MVGGTTSAPVAGAGTYQKAITTRGAAKTVARTRQHTSTASCARTYTKCLPTMTGAAATGAGKSEDVILEKGNRGDFKRCLIECIETLQYPCGHIHIFVYNTGDAIQESIPLACQRCTQHSIFFADLSWGKTAINGVTYTQDTINIDMLYQPIMPIETISFSCTITGDGTHIVADEPNP
jgi:hypothetical protein